MNNAKTEMMKLMARKTKLNCTKFEPNFDAEKYEAEMNEIRAEEQRLLKIMKRA